MEIGGGVGELQVELLRRGASRVTNLELSEKLRGRGGALTGKLRDDRAVTRRLIEVAQAPNAVEPADVVALHRVVCCYADYARFLNVAADHPRRTLAYSHPAANIVNRVQFSTENTYRRLTRNDFRAFIHSPDAMVHAAEYDGLTLAYRSHAWDWDWDVVGLAR